MTLIKCLIIYLFIYHTKVMYVFINWVPWMASMTYYMNYLFIYIDTTKLNVIDCVILVRYCVFP